MSYAKQVSLNEENPETKIYYGVSETAFKRKYVNHNKNKKKYIAK